MLIYSQIILLSHNQLQWNEFCDPSAGLLEHHLLQI